MKDIYGKELAIGDSVIILSLTNKCFINIGKVTKFISDLRCTVKTISFDIETRRFKAKKHTVSPYHIIKLKTNFNIEDYLAYQNERLEEYEF